MTQQMLRVIAIGVVTTMVVGCATGRAVRRAESAGKKGDWDEAVEYYREAIGRAPDRADVKIRLQRAIQTASAEHVRLARELEAQGQMQAAIIEYRRATALDPASTLALTKATELERQIRTAAEASQPQPKLDALRQQAERSSPIPRLDPRARIAEMRYTNAAVRDLMKTVSDLTGLNIQYDTSADASLSRPYTIDVTDTPLEDVLNQILQTFTLTYKVVNAKTILVYQDNQNNRQKFEDQYLQTYYLSTADPTELQNQLSQVFAGINMSNRPAYTANKAANSLTVRGTAPVLQMINDMVKSIDRPTPEVFIQAEILEVDRAFVRQIGLDLSQWSLGFTFSPEVAPPSTSGGFPPASPPPMNLNSLKGINRGDFFLTSPTALIKLLESNSSTKVLARPEQRGRAGQAMTLALGDSIPLPQTVFQSAAAGGVANVPTTSVTYTAVGINLQFTPRVTYQDEIILDTFTLEKSGLGSNISVGGQDFPTIVTRRTQTSLGLRDGESTLIAGLLRDDDRKAYSSLPGLSRLPILSSIFGNSDRQVDQTELVMIITAHIARGHNLTVEDLKPRFIGTGTNIGAGAPQLISAEALLGGPAPAGGAVALGGNAPSVGGLVQSTSAANQPAAPAANRVPGVVPIQAVNSGTSAPPTPGQGRIVITAPATGPDGTVPAGGGPYTMPIQISDVQNVASISLTITYNPSVLSNLMTGQGTFMNQGGVTATFTPAVNAGRIDMAIARPTSQPGASGSGTLGAISFTAGVAGSSDVTISGVAMTTTGQAVPLQFTSTKIAVR